MARPNPPPSRLDRLKLQRAQVDAKIKALEARNRTQSRKDDTRRKIITGALALEHMQRHEAFAETMMYLGAGTSAHTTFEYVQSVLRAPPKV